ncbi:uncharacterized protein LOC118164483 [Oxyura jamaicensis]|uniref:uncharacterized protein LOC118164483 n=1 Tax=Oxyura jamaicensis TaxID=8884 RepID=UPI0015A6E576|nr:uncharacterized protein LOC118164483 [Oxyura jamaicensis]
MTPLCSSSFGGCGNSPSWESNTTLLKAGRALSIRIGLRFIDRISWGGGRERGKRRICSSSEALLGFICIVLLEPSGSGRLTAVQVSSELCLGSPLAPRSAPGRARLPPAYGAAGSEAPHPAPLREGTRSPGRWHGVNCQPKDWVVRSPASPLHPSLLKGDSRRKSLMNFYGRFVISRRLWYGVKEPACTQGGVGKRRALSFGANSFPGVVTTRQLSESAPKGGRKERREGHYTEAFPRSLHHLLNTGITKHPWREEPSDKRSRLEAKNPFQKAEKRNEQQQQQ